MSTWPMLKLLAVRLVLSLCAGIYANPYAFQNGVQAPLRPKP